MSANLYAVIRAADCPSIHGLRNRWAEYANGAHRCNLAVNPAGDRCGKKLGPDDGICCAEHEPERVRRFRISAARWRESWLKGEEEHLDRASIFRQLPELPNARVDDADFTNKVPPSFRSFAEKWHPRHGSALLSGPPGSWKTSSLVSLVHRVRRDALAEVTALPLETLDEYFARRSWDEDERDDGKRPARPPLLRDALHGMHWTTGLELVFSVRRHPLGQGEPEAMTRAKQAPILLLDELGPQVTTDRDAIIMEVLDHRYSRRLPTLATTGMDRAEFSETHGGGVWRRLTDDGVGRFLTPGPAKGARG